MDYIKIKNFKSNEEKLYLGKEDGLELIKISLDYIEVVSRKTVEYDQTLIIQSLKKIYTYCNIKIKQWFKKIEYSYCEEHLVRQVFKIEYLNSESNEMNKFQYIIFLRMFEDLIKEFELVNNDREYIKKEDFRFIYDTINDFLSFVVDSKPYNSEIDISPKVYKRKQCEPYEAFNASKMILRYDFEEMKIGYDALRESAEFLIRQAIELRVVGIFGIENVVNKKGKMIRIPSLYNVIFEYFTDNIESIEIPISKSILKNIYNWTNFTIHGGVLPYIWQTWYAQRLLEPLFSWGTHNNSQYIHGSVKLPRKIYDDIIPYIEKKYTEKYPTLSINVTRMKKPYAFIID